MTNAAGSRSKPKFVAGPGADDDTVATTLYFGYGSNLSSTQMCSRCPDSEPAGLAFLPGYRFIVNERGYANVVPVESGAPKSRDQDGQSIGEQQGQTRKTGLSHHRAEQGVYGVAYRISDEDEELLDGFEGVTWGSYDKEVRTVELLMSSGEWQEKQMLVYIDRLRTSEDAPMEEYIARMNRGIDEATKEWGLPKEYVDDVIRRFIPPAPDA